MDVKNLFANVTDAHRAEEFLTLFENAHASPSGFWYDQEDDEWVTVLRGTATLEFTDGAQMELKAGDYLTIPRRVKHRVARTSSETIWLAVHIK